MRGFRTVALIGVVGAAIGGPPRVARADQPATAPAANQISGLTLESAVQLALTRNERAAIVDLNIVQSEAAVDRARVAFMPVLSASGNDTLRPRDKPIDTATGQVQITQPLLQWSAFPLYDQAKHALAAELHQAVEDKRQLAFDTAKAFYNVLLADKVLEAAQRKLDTANADVADTFAQSKAQIVSSNDVTRAKISQASAVREVASDQGSLAAARVQLEFLINARIAGALVEPTAALAAGNAPMPADPSGLVNESFTGRPDLLARKDTALAAHDFAREPHYRFLPTLSLQGQLSATSNAGNSGNTVDGSIALTAQWAIYDGGARSADERTRDAAAAIADRTTDNLVRSIDAAVRSAAVQLTAAQGALAASKDAVDAARKSADETAILYKQGLAKAIELVDANEQRFTAEVSYAEAEISVATAHLALRQAMGLGPIGDAK